MNFIKKFNILILIFSFSATFSFSQNTIKNFQKKQISVYDKPYSFTKNDIDYKAIKNNVFLVLGGTVAGVVILYLMPESFTNWNKDDIKGGKIFSKWRKHIKDGPVKDEDDWFLNWITHPYWGAVYYMSARSNGANAINSFLFSVFTSTFFWEYGVEAFAEIPSKQDLIITPIIGSIIGEGFYLTKRHIYNNDYKLFNSKILGRTTSFLMDPITELINLFKKNKKSQNDFSSFAIPFYNNERGFSYTLYLTYKF